MTLAITSDCVQKSRKVQGHDRGREKSNGTMGLTQNGEERQKECTPDLYLDVGACKDFNILL